MKKMKKKEEEMVREGLKEYFNGCGRKEDVLMDRSLSDVVKDWDNFIDAIMDWEKNLYRDNTESIVGLMKSFGYRLAFLVLLKEIHGKVVFGLMRINNVSAMCGVKISVMINKLGVDVVKVYLVDVLQKVIGEKEMKNNNEMILLVSRVVTDLNTFTMEMLIRGIGYGKSGRYGKVYNELRSGDVIQWLKAYRKKSIEEVLKKDSGGLKIDGGMNDLFNG